jgi:hypothetical protein
MVLFLPHSKHAINQNPYKDISPKESFLVFTEHRAGEAGMFGSPAHRFWDTQCLLSKPYKSTFISNFPWIFFNTKGFLCHFFYVVPFGRMSVGQTDERLSISHACMDRY